MEQLVCIPVTSEDKKKQLFILYLYVVYSKADDNFLLIVALQR